MGERSGAPSGFSPASIVISKPPVAVHLPQPDVSDNRDAPHARPLADSRRLRLWGKSRQAGGLARRGRRLSGLAAGTGHGEVRRTLRLRADAGAAREQEPTRLRGLQAPARRALRYRLSQHAAWRAARAALAV